MTIRVADLPDLGTVTDGTSFVGEHAGSGRFAATALRTYLAGTFATQANLAAEAAARKRDTISVMEFSATGNGTTDDTSFIQAALDSVGSATIRGGTVLLPPGYTFRAGNLTIPPGVTLQGPHGTGPGAPGMANFSPPYNTQAALRLNAGATITLAGGSGLSGLLIAPYGMTFQQTTSAAFAGTAITATGDDVVVERCMIMGFAQGFSASGVSRIRIRDCNMDNLAGIFVSGSTDVGHFESVQMWPFATISQAGTDTLRRSGIGFRIADSNDDSRFTDCFAYGYTAGFSVEGLCVGQVFTSCAADSTNVGIGIGFNIVGGATEVQLIDCQSSAQNIGYNLTESIAGDVLVTLTNCAAWACTAHGMLVDTAALGDVTIRGGSISGCANAISVASSVARVDIDGVRFETIAAASAITASVATSRVRIGPMCNFGTNGAGSTGTAVGTNLAFPSLASASAIALPSNASALWITGTTGIGTINGGWTGRVITLLFTASTPVFHSIGTSGIRLAGGVSITTANGGTLKLIHSGSQWYQIGGTPTGHIETAGTATNDNAAAGQIGEYVSSSVAVGSAVSLTTTVIANVTSIALSAGDWDLNGLVSFQAGTATSATLLQGWMSTASAASPTAPNGGGQAMLQGFAIGATGPMAYLPTGVMRLSLAAPATVYLSAHAVFTTSTLAAFGFIGARRAR